MFWTVFLPFRTLLDITKFVVGLALFLFIALPFVFKYTPWIQRHLVFLPFARLARCGCYSDGSIFWSDPVKVEAWPTYIMQWACKLGSYIHSVIQKILLNFMNKKEKVFKKDFFATTLRYMLLYGYNIDTHVLRTRPSLFNHSTTRVEINQYSLPPSGWKWKSLYTCW